MFNFFKKKDTSVRLEAFLTLDHDIHSHILPGLDDGSPDIISSIELVKGLSRLGIKKIIATPHIIGDLYRNDTNTITKSLKLLEMAIQKEGIDVSIQAAAEYMLDDYFLSLIRNKIPLLTIHDNIILTEFSYAIAPTNLEKICFEILTSGYTPILAHPERYSYLNSINRLEKIKDLGFLFQVNILSVAGYYGSPIQKRAKLLFEKGMVDYIGTDIHHERHLDYIKNNLNTIQEVIGYKKFNVFSIDY